MLRLKVKSKNGGQRGRGRSRLRKKVLRLVLEGNMHLADHGGLLRLM